MISQEIVQKRFTSASPEELYQLGAPYTRVECKRMIICNTSGSIATFRLYFNNTGNSFGVSNQLFHDEGSAIEAGGTFDLDMSNIGLVNQGSAIGIRAERNNVLTVTLFGIPYIGGQ